VSDVQPHNSRRCQLFPVLVGTGMRQWLLECCGALSQIRRGVGGPPPSSQNQCSRRELQLPRYHFESRFAGGLSGEFFSTLENEERRSTVHSVPCSASSANRCKRRAFSLSGSDRASRRYLAARSVLILNLSARTENWNRKREPADLCI
jgi:hypothetical protein